MQKDKSTSNDLENITQKTKDCTPCSRRVVVPVSLVTSVNLLLNYTKIIKNLTVKAITNTSNFRFTKFKIILITLLTKKKKKRKKRKSPHQYSKLYNSRIKSGSMIIEHYCCYKYLNNFYSTRLS